MKIKILLIKRGALGDILMATPLIRQLKRVLPDVQIDFLTSESCAVVIRDNPYLNQVIRIDNKLFGIKQIFKLIRYLFTLRNKNYDYVFVLDKHYYFSFLGRIVSRNTVGFWRDSLSLLFLKYRVKYNDVTRYQGLYYLDLLKVSKLATVNYNDYGLDLRVGDEYKGHQIYLKYKLEPTQFVVVVNSGGNQAFESSGIRMLPMNKITALLDGLSKHIKVVLLGSDADRANYQSYIDQLSGDSDRIINLAGECTMGQSLEILRDAKLIFTTDCGVMHFALSQNIAAKLICFFGPTCPDHVLPPDSLPTVYWHDKAIFDKNYQIYGKLPVTQNFFTSLDIVAVIRNCLPKLTTRVHT